MKGACGFLVLAPVTRGSIGADLVDDGLLGLEIVHILRLDTAEVLLLVVEEMIAGGTETGPDLVRFLTGHRSDLLPLLLEGDKVVGGLLPVRAVLNGLSLLAEGYLLLHIAVHLLLEVSIELTLAVVELVTGGAETVIYLLVVLLGGKAYLAPLLLDVLELLARFSFCCTFRFSK